MPTILTGQMDLSSANEGVALASNTDVASFTVNNSTDTASAFTATIDWGDGTTTTGTVVGSNGSFTVDGGHTYADEGFPQATVTITRTADNTQIAAIGNVAVAVSVHQGKPRGHVPWRRPGRNTSRPRIRNHCRYGVRHGLHKKPPR